MDDRSAVFIRGHGVALRRDLLAAGYVNDDIRRLLRKGQLVRVRRGAYAERALWQSLDDVGRHLLKARAVVASLRPPARLSHASAAIALGLPVWGVPLDKVHVTRPGRSQSRHEGDVVHHNGVLPAEQIAESAGLPVTSADRTVLDLARLAGFEPGVVAADAALHQGLVTAEGLLALANDLASWPGSRVVGRVVSFSDGRSESVGESRARVLMYLQGLPAPELQVEIRDRGRLVARVDFLDEESMTVIEFDGRIKYRLGESDDPRVLENVLWSEKRREDDVRALGYGFARVTWSDLDHPARTAARLRTAMSFERDPSGLWRPEARRREGRSPEGRRPA